VRSAMALARRPLRASETPRGTRLLVVRSERELRVRRCIRNSRNAIERRSSKPAHAGVLVVVRSRQGSGEPEASAVPIDAGWGRG
jgi:hypothetical protein